ncbi:PIN domain-containing protein [Candidatus Woesearchaeota archaeon]|nr:PIN domain-containing protein [Candidatus Woesearchaeota archaeon]
MVIFLDTYAIIEIDKGNISYKKYTLKPLSAITTLFNIIEVYFVYLKIYNKKEAERIFNIIKPLVIHVDDFILKEAMEFKLINEKIRFSFADCIGYTTALKYKAKFLTGDFAFKNLDNVEFVK